MVLVSHTENMQLIGYMAFNKGTNQGDNGGVFLGGPRSQITVRGFTDLDAPNVMQGCAHRSRARYGFSSCLRNCGVGYMGFLVTQYRPIHIWSEFLALDARNGFYIWAFFCGNARLPPLVNNCMATQIEFFCQLGSTADDLDGAVQRCFNFCIHATILASFSINDRNSI